VYLKENRKNLLYKLNINAKKKGRIKFFVYLYKRKELPKTKHIKLNNIYKEMVLYRIISLFNIYELFNKLSNSII